MAELYPSLDMGPQPELDQPDYQQMRDDRMGRNRRAMQALDPGVLKEILPKNCELSQVEKAALCIQRYFRGYKGRQLYRDLLFERFEEEERMRQEKTMQQVEEGQLLVDNHKLEVLLDDDRTTRRNRDRHYLSQVITIQRAWKGHLRNKHENKKKLDRSLPEEDVTSNSESDEDEYSETESAICGQVMTLSTPEENQHQEDNERETTLTVGSFLGKKSPVRQLRDIECESVLSDVSEIAGPLKDIESEVQIIEREELQRGNFSFLPGHNQKEIDRLPGETDSDYCKRARKINILSLAQEFAELKKINADALPFDLHKGREFVKESSPESDASSGIGAEEYLTESAMTSPADAKRDLTDGEGGKSGLTVKSRKHRVKDSGSNHRVKGGRSKRDSSPSVGSDMEKSGDFDVYNMESTLPQMDWETLEQQLQLAAQEEKNRSQTRLNDREEIRRKLAMGTDEEYYYNERTFKKPNLQTRLQSGMNLQICFMNEAVGEQQDSGEATVEKNSSIPQVKNAQEPKPVTSGCQSLEHGSKSGSKSKSKSSSKSSHQLPSILVEDDEDFFKKQARLQDEAKLALAQACTMAHMQLEVEKQLKKKSPIADMVGIPSLGDGRRRKINKKVLHDMNLAQLQVLVNDLHTQIEGLNEELVQMLMERDDLHMEQDSMLVDIEDLSRRAKEVAQQATNNNSPSSNNHNRPRKK
ncbi:IQCJ-SCHIP1 readthrough transcript protein-like isoform X1 [Haliotis asinina]|uniref:IQCJ-SCHIP1 readthrough transcript protein-like isoform X1 n=2 Tax=Haliotis asinina TaxID=109174 RepID=UPI0035318F7E